MTRLPFVALFQQVTSLIAPEFFEKGNCCLEAATEEIDRWPVLQPGEVLNLPLMGTVFQVIVDIRSCETNQKVVIQRLFSHRSRYRVSQHKVRQVLLCPLNSFTCRQHMWIYTLRCHLYYHTFKCFGSYFCAVNRWS